MEREEATGNPNVGHLIFLIEAYKVMKAKPILPPSKYIISQSISYSDPHFNIFKCACK